MSSLDAKHAVRRAGANPPARPAQPAQPAGRSSRRRRRAPAGLAVLRGCSVGYLNPQRGQPCRIVPNLANPAQISAGAVNVWSAWAQVTAGEASDTILGAAFYAFVSGVTDVYHFQLGIGAAGAEVPIAEWEDGSLISGAGSIPVPGHSRRLPYVRIPAGTRIAIRGYDESAGPTTGGIGAYVALLPYPLAGWDTWDDRYAAGDRSQGSTRTPAVGSWVALTAGSPGPWAQVVAAAPQEQLLIALQRSAATNPRIAQYDIGLGPAGAEVVHERVATPLTNAIIPGITNAELPRPLRVHAGERVAVRQTYPGMGTAAQIALTFENIIE